MSDAPTYEIVSVWDFLKVPEDRLPECLREFAIALEMARNTIGVLNLLSPDVRWQTREAFNWTDDNAHNATIKIHVPRASSTPGSESE